MAKKANLKDPSGNILYPYTLLDCVRDTTGTILKNLVVMQDYEFTESEIEALYGISDTIMQASEVKL